jgi:hypothetical protein
MKATCMHLDDNRAAIVLSAVIWKDYLCNRTKSCSKTHKPLLEAGSLQVVIFRRFWKCLRLVDILFQGCLDPEHRIGDYMFALSRVQYRCETDVSCVSELKMLEKDLISLGIFQI